THSYTLSLHDALPISNNKTREEELTTGLVREYLEYDGLNRLTRQRISGPGLPTGGYLTSYAFDDANNAAAVTDARGVTTRTTKRSEEHTSELQSRSDL